MRIERGIVMGEGADSRNDDSLFPPPPPPADRELESDVEVGKIGFVEVTAVEGSTNRVPL